MCVDCYIQLCHDSYANYGFIRFFDAAIYFVDALKAIGTFLFIIFW